MGISTSNLLSLMLILLLFNLAMTIEADSLNIQFDLVFPRNETYAPTQYFPLVLAVRNPVAVWTLGLSLMMVIWPHSEDVPPFNSTYEFPHTGEPTSGLPLSGPNFFFIAGTPYANATAGGFTVIWSVTIRHKCREENPLKDPHDLPYTSGEFNVQFSTAIGAPLPDIEAAMNSCLEPTSSLALTSQGLRDDCPLLDTNSTTPSAESLCSLKSVGKDLAANVSIAMLGLMGCDEGIWQTITERYPEKQKSGTAIGLKGVAGFEIRWMLVLAFACCLLTNKG